MSQQPLQRPPDPTGPPQPRAARPLSMSEDRILRDRYLANRRPQSVVGATGTSSDPRAFVMAAAARASQAGSQRPQPPPQQVERAQHRRNRSLSSVVGPSTAQTQPMQPRSLPQGQTPSQKQPQRQPQRQFSGQSQRQPQLQRQPQSQLQRQPQRQSQPQMQRQPQRQAQARTGDQTQRRASVRSISDHPDGSPSPAAAAAVALHQRRPSTSSVGNRSRESSLTSQRRPSTVSSSSSGRTVNGPSRSRSSTLTSPPPANLARLAAGQAAAGQAASGQAASHKPSHDTNMSTEPELATMAARSEVRPTERVPSNQPNRSRSSSDVDPMASGEKTATVAAGAAARASAARAVDVAPKEPPLSAKLRSNLAQALKLEARKREEEQNEDSDSDDYNPGNDPMMQTHNLLWRRATQTADAAAKSARMHQLMAAAKPTLEPRNSSDSQSTTQSNKTNALSAALAARSRAQSAVAKIYMEASQLSDPGGRVSSRMKRYRPTAQWSAFPPHGQGGPTGFGTATLRKHPTQRLSNVPEPDDDSRSTTSSRSTPGSFESAYSRLPPAPPTLPASHQQPPAPPEVPFGMTDPVKLEPKHKKHGFWKKLLGGSSQTRPQPESSTSETRSLASESDVVQPMMMQTLRRNDSRRRFNQEKPWKHHRIEQAMTERERKRYEKLWAANRGTFLKYFVFFDPEGNPILPEEHGLSTPTTSTMASHTNNGTSGGSGTMASPIQPGSAAGAMASPTASVTSVSHGPYLHPSMAARPPSVTNQSTHSITHSMNQSVLSASPSASLGPPIAPTVSNTSLVSTTSSADALIASESDVHGYVVSRIWKRSCLPEDTLGRVWDLVDTNKDGTLDRSSFVVGMWLVDQCLYGRKLPNKVDDVVWQSVGKLHVKIRVGKPHHHRNIVQRAPHAAVHGGKHLMKATAKGAAKGGISVVRKAVGSNSNNN